MTVITDYVSSTIAGLVRQADCLRALNSPQLNLPKGELKELFVSRLLKSFLPSQLSVGSGVVINMAGTQSGQTDIIVYDNRILPPFIQEQNLGVYPVESVIGVIEVKTTLDTEELQSARRAAELLTTLFVEERDLCRKENIIVPWERPLCAVFAFDVKGMDELCNPETGDEYLKEFPPTLLICVAGKFSWAKVGESERWTAGTGNTDPVSRVYDYGETARFIALFVDNVRTAAERRHTGFGQQVHRDWLSLYIRKR